MLSKEGIDAEDCLEEDDDDKPAQKMTMEQAKAKFVEMRKSGQLK